MKYKQDEKEKYIEYANLIIEKRKNFYKRFKLFDIKNDCIIQKEYDYLYYLKNDYLYYNFVSKALNEKYQYKKDYTAIFLTLTLDSVAHKYKQNKKGKLIYNKNYDEKFTINRSYKILNNFFRNLYKDFRIKGKWISFDFVKVIEPHSDFTPHLHSIIYVKSSHLKDFLSYIDTHIAKNAYMGRYEVEILNNLSRANAYLIKYLQKSYVDKLNENDLKMFLGWRLKNKIRMFTSSQLLLQRNIFNRAGFAHIGKKFLQNEANQEYLETSNLYLYYSYLTGGKILITDEDGSNENQKEFNITTFEEIPKRLSFFIHKYRIKKKNELYEQYIQELLRYNDLYIKLEILEENDIIFNKFSDFLFFNYHLSWLEFYDEPNFDVIDEFIIYLSKNIYSYQYKIKEYRISKKIGREFKEVFNKNNYKVNINIVNTEQIYASIPKKPKLKINYFYNNSIKSVSSMSEIEKFYYKKELQLEKENPFNSQRDLKIIKDKEYILNKFI